MATLEVKNLIVLEGVFHTQMNRLDRQQKLDLKTEKDKANDLSR